MHGMNRYVIGFGFEYDRAGNPLFLEQADVAGIVERVAASIALPCYSLRFGPGCWQDENGVRVHEQGGTVEYVASADVTTARVARSFAELLREELRQECAVYYIQPVSLFEYV
jgi:hypothetical protein